MLDDFFSHSWSTSRFDKWAALLLYMNAVAAAAALIGTALLWALLEMWDFPDAVIFYHVRRQSISHERHANAHGLSC